MWCLRLRHGLIAVVFGLGLGQACLAAAPPPTPQQTPPVLSVQLEVRGGKVAIRAAATQLTEPLPGVYGGCRIEPKAMQQDLTRYLEPLLLGGDKLLTRLVRQSISGQPAADGQDTVVQALDALAKTDELTRKLWADESGFAWEQGQALLQAWEAARRAEGSRLVAAPLRMSDAYDQALVNADYADGPLKPLAPDTDTGPGRKRVISGVVDFEVAPPLVNAAAKLRLTRNVGQWAAVQGELGGILHDEFECRLWFSKPIEATLRDYLEVRGLSVQRYRTAQDVKDAGDQGAATEPPDDRAAIRLMRPQFQDADHGGRIFLDPDPLLEAVYVQAGPGDGERLDRALYLLLPTGDFDRVRASPGDYLCRGKAIWVPDETKPDAVQLPLDGSMPGLKGARLAAAQVYLTRAALARRLQQLNANGLDLRTVTTEDVNPLRGAGQRRRLAVLAVEPHAGAEALSAQALPALPACSTPRDAKPEPPGECGTGNNGLCTSPPLAPVEPPLQPRTARDKPDEASRRNRLDFNLERRPGKPWAFGTAYRRQGLRADDSFTVGLGVQKQVLGDFSYSGDFAGLGIWGRRLQWTARAYSAYEPEVGTDASRPDERREGGELRATLDLWRDMHHTSAQLELAVRREATGFDTSGTAHQRVSAVDTVLVLTRSREATPASPREELVFSATHGHSELGDFSKGGVTLALRRFVGAFSLWDLRARVQIASRQAPLAEWVRFGGEDTVRGYIADRTTARQAWAIQNEYWLPLPWTPPSPELASTLRRNLALAAFVDVGEVRSSSTDFTGRKAGAGLGLRYRPDSTVTLRLDVARPVGRVAEADRRTRIYFTVSAFTPI